MSKCSSSFQSSLFRDQSERTASARGTSSWLGDPSVRSHWDTRNKCATQNSRHGYPSSTIFSPDAQVWNAPHHVHEAWERAATPTKPHPRQYADDKRPKQGNEQNNANQVVRSAAARARTTWRCARQHRPAILAGMAVIPPASAGRLSEGFSAWVSLQSADGTPSQLLLEEPGLRRRLLRGIDLFEHGERRPRRYGCRTRVDRPLACLGLLLGSLPQYDRHNPAGLATLVRR